MAVMLRTQGIPARVATGYATGDYDYSRRAYAVTAGSAHAWVEVYFPGFDWVEFEPTASQTPFAYAGLAQAVPGTTPAPAAGPTSLPPAVTTILLGLGMAGGIALLVLLLRFLGAGPRPGPKVDANLLALSHYFYVRRALRQAGVAAASSTTPDEFLAQAGPRLSQRRGLSNALRQATRVYEEAAFSPRPPALRQVETARRAWAGSFWEWLRLAGGNLIKSTTSRSSPQRRRGHRGFTEKKNIKV